MSPLGSDCPSLFQMTMFFNVAVWNYLAFRQAVIKHGGPKLEIVCREAGIGVGKHPLKGSVSDFCTGLDWGAGKTQ